MKIAVLTRDLKLFHTIAGCFRADVGACVQFQDDVDLTRAVYREAYDAIFVDAATLTTPTHALFARRDCFADRRAPLLVVGSFSSQHTLTEALESGADDVVVTPINPAELMARTQFALQRFRSTHAVHPSDIVRLGPYELHRRSCRVLIHQRPVKLTVREFAIAWLLFSNAGEFITRPHLAGAIWSSTEDIVARTIEQHIYKLRKKLELDGHQGVQLRTMYAHGYRIDFSDTPVTRSARQAAARDAEAVGYVPVA